MKLDHFIKNYIEEKIDQPELKQLLIQSIEEKSPHFLFHRLANAHLNIWNPDIEEQNRILLLSSVELFVLAGDILDDLQDADTDKPIWMKCESKFSMNAVLTLFNMSQQMAMKAFENKQNQVRASFLFLEKQQSALIGQHHSLLKKPGTEKELTKTMLCKAGTFFSYACLLGSLHAPDETQNEIARYAEIGGAIAQLENDLSGITKREHFKDIVMKEQTLPIRFLLHHGNSTAFPISAYYEGAIEGTSWIRDEDIVESLIQQTGVTFYARHQQQLLWQKAVHIIERVYADQKTQESVKSFILGR